MILINNHAALIDASMNAAVNDAVCRKQTGRPSEYSAAVRAGVQGEIINLSAQYAALLDLVKMSQGEEQPMTDALRKEACRVGIVPCSPTCTAFAHRPSRSI